MQEQQDLDARCCRLKLFVSLLVLLFVLTPSFVFANHSNKEWLALNIYHEARGETVSGMMAVGIVTINRVMDRKFPNTIKDVVTQPGQFSWYWDGKSDKPTNKKIYQKCLSVSKILMDMWKSDIFDVIIRQTGLDGVKWYHNKDVRPRWAYVFHHVGDLDNHKFYKM